MAVTPVPSTQGTISGAVLVGTQGIASGRVMAGSGGQSILSYVESWDEPTHCGALKADSEPCRAPKAKSTDYCIGHLRAMEKAAS